MFWAPKRADFPDCRTFKVMVPARAELTWDTVEDWLQQVDIGVYPQKVYDLDFPPLISYRRAHTQ
jgi:hypothetical protein